MRTALSVASWLLLFTVSSASPLRAQDTGTVPVNFVSESIEDWQVIPPVLSEFESAVARGPIFSDGRSVRVCNLSVGPGIPQLLVDLGENVVLLCYDRKSDQIGGCTNPDLVSGVEAFIPPLPVGDYVFLYDENDAVPDDAEAGCDWDGLAVEIPFTVESGSEASDLPVGRVTDDPAGEEADELSPTLDAADFAWVRAELEVSEGGLVVFGASDIQRVVAAEPGPVVPQRTVPGSGNVSPVLSRPAISAAGFVAWEAVDSNGTDDPADDDLDILVSNGVETLNISDGIDEDDGRVDGSPRISGIRVVWESAEPGDESTSEIYHADLSGFPDGPVTPVRITTNDIADFDARVSGPFVVWVGADESGDSDIFYVNLDETPCDPTPCDPPAIDDPLDVSEGSPWISGSRVVWQRAEPSEGEPAGEGADFEIFYADLADPIVTPHALTANAYPDVRPYIADERVVWEGFVPDLLPSFADDSEVFFADLRVDPIVPLRLTDNDAFETNIRVRGPVPQDLRVGVFWEVLTASGRSAITIDAANVDPNGVPLEVPQILSTGPVGQGSLQVSDDLVLWTQLVDDEPQDEQDPDPLENLEIFSSPPIAVPEPGPVALRAAVLVALALLAPTRRGRAQRR